jgi:hypothetical protein
MAHPEGSALAGARALTAAHRWREVAQRANGEEQMSARCPPDLPRCPFRLTVEREWPVPPSALYAVGVKRVDLWFAASGSAVMRTEGNAPSSVKLPTNARIKGLLSGIPTTGAASHWCSINSGSSHGSPEPPDDLGGCAQVRATQDVRTRVAVR